jgi:hypothetical protein
MVAHLATSFKTKTVKNTGKKDNEPLRKKQKKIISHKVDQNPNKPNSKKFPENLPSSDYVTIPEKIFKKKLKD